MHQTATHCTTLQHDALHCTTLHHTAPHCSTLHHTAAHCTTLHHTATHRMTLQHTAPHCNTLHHTAPHCTTLHHTAARSSIQHQGNLEARRGDHIGFLPLFWIMARVTNSVPPIFATVANDAIIINLPPPSPSPTPSKPLLPFQVRFGQFVVRFDSIFALISFAYQVLVACITRVNSYIYACML